MNLVLFLSQEPQFSCFNAFRFYTHAANIYRRLFKAVFL